MIDLSPEIITLLLFGGILVGVVLGYPLAISVGAVGLLVGLLVFNPKVVGDMYYQRMFNQVTNYTLIAVPFFIFMGIMLERTGVAEQLYEAMYQVFGGLRGGLALTTILIGTIMAACVGVIAASVMMLAVIGIPAMLKRGYSKPLATGCVCAGGTLGILIPPSIMLVIYGPMANLGVGSLFFGAFMPGFLLSGLYMLYIVIFTLLFPSSGPAVPIEERNLPVTTKLLLLVKSLIPPLLIILAVLGSIFFGIAAPTEAAAVGALAATLLAVAYRKFSWKALRETALTTIRHSGMILLLASLSFAFVGIFIRAHCGEVVSNFLLSAPGGKWGVFFVIMFICFILGMFIDWIGIVFIMVPIITPIGAALGFDPLWFGMMICVNLQMSFLTPPFAYAIFFVRAASPPEYGVTTNDVIKGVLPFIVLIMIGLVLCVVFPQIILWLPGKML